LVRETGQPSAGRPEVVTPPASGRGIMVHGARQLSAEPLGGMRDIGSPSDLFDRLVGLFPALADELADEPVESYHQVITLVSHRFAELLKISPESTKREFGDLINSMVSQGGEQENAISTCLLEHSSQIGIRAFIRPFLTPAAKRELR
jgi:hypothetical protein